MNLRQVYFGLIAIAGIALTDLSFAQQQVQIKGPKDATEQYSGATFGPIKSSDTLWRIANRYRQNKNLSIYQVMQAIYELNPEAFENNNFNQLKNGAILRLPSERYVARIDAEDAKNRAELDDLNWQPRTGADSSVQATPLSPAETLASKVDLNQTKEDLEKKLVAIDEEQNRQFMAIRQQFAESISNVQTLLDENQKLYDRLDVVNQDIEGLRTRVDEELKIQIDQVLEIQNELLSISREAEAQRQAEMEKTSLDFLKDPLTLIIGSTLLTLSLLVGFAVWLLKRKKSEPVAEQPIMQTVAEAPIAEQTTEMDDLTDALSDELSDELDEDLAGDDLFGEDDLLDDVLSDELQESLDEALDEELESFDDLGDEMLVPEADKPESAEDEEAEAVLEQGDLDSLFDEDDALDELDSEMDAIDLSDTDELTEAIEDDASDELEQLLDQDDLDDILEESLGEVTEPETEESDELEEDVVDLAEPMEEEPELEADVEDTDSESLASVEDDQEKPEISIDELLEEPEPAVPETIDVDDSENISEEMLQQLDKEIATQNQELDNITDELLNEIEQLEQMEAMLPAEDDEEEAEDTAEGETQHGIQQLDDLSEPVDDALAEEEIDDLPGDEQDELADELLAEMGVDIDGTEVAEELSEPDEQDDLADELLAELGVKPEASEDVADTQAEQSGAQEQIEEQADEQDELADELLAELGVEDDAEASEPEASSDVQDDLADEILADMGVVEEAEEEQSVEQQAADQQDELADELLDELGVEPESEEASVENDADAIEQPDEQPAEQPAETEALADELLDELDADFDDIEEVEAEAPAEDADFPEAETEQSAEIVDELLEEEPALVEESGAEDLPEIDPEFEPQPEQSGDALDVEQSAELDEPASDDLVDSPEEELDAPLSADEVDFDDLDIEVEEQPEPSIDEQDTVEESLDESVDESEDKSVEHTDEDSLLSSEDVEDTSIDELLEELGEEQDSPELLDAEPSSSDFDEVAETHALEEDDLDIPSFTDSESQGEMDDFDKALDDFDKALDDFEQEVPEESELTEEQTQPLDEIEEDATDKDVSTSVVDDLPGLDDIDALTDFDDSELEKALDSYAEEHEELVLDEEPAQKTIQSEPEDLDDVPGLDDWLTEEGEEDALDESLFDELENTSFDELLDNIEDKDEESTKAQDALLDNPDLDIEALLTEDDSLDELDVGLAENEVEEPEEDFLDVDALLNESIDAEADPETEKELDLDVSLEQFTGVTGDADTIDVDSDEGLGAKMDLARAYLEIEDSESAREILQEIAEKGEPDQQSEAEELLKTLK